MRIWKRITDELSGEIGAESVALWLLPLLARCERDVLQLYASNPHVESEARSLLPHIEKVAKRLMPELVRIELTVGDGGAELAAGTNGLSNPRFQENSAISARPHVGAARAPLPADFDSRLDARYSFANFVEGRSNQLAKHTALQVTRHLGAASYNPLMLYGGTGLGKSHILHALGNAIVAQDPNARVMYVRSEDFVTAMLKALRGEAMEQFKALYRGLDCLLIDDIQFFAGKERSQEEFFHTFNTLYDSRQQIVMTCDRFPKELERFEQRLQSRFGWGLSVAVEPPDFETRVEILLAKAHAMRVNLEQEVAELVAKRMRSNVRELEGALHTLTARAHFSGQAISLEFAMETLRDLFSVQDRSVSLSSIQKSVAEFYRVSLSDLLSPKRTRSIARARQFAMALTKELTTHSLKEIGESFGGRDHTTVLHACRLVEELKKTDGQVFEDWQSMLRKLVG